MRKIEGVLTTYSCPRCGNELLTSVIAIPKDDVLHIQYSKYCEIHGTIKSVTEEEILV